MTGLALALLIYFGVSGVWDILEPDAVRIKFGNPFRGLCAFAAQVALITLCLSVLAASATAVAIVVCSYVVLATLGVLAQR